MKKLVRSRRLRALGRWALLILLLGGVYQWQTRHMLVSGSQVEEISLLSLQRESILLAADERPVLLYFFAPWCGICAASIGNLNSLDSKAVRVITIAMDYGSVEEVWEFVRRHEVSGPVLLGHQELKMTFNLRGYPTYYLLDRDNRVLASDMGYSSGLGLKVRQWLASGL
ncbi:TlpA family protein disulfide reductase [Bowmanella dokdonensis]|uniref:Redoxin family protein n=1 Tax=Bowmanella dokdonensis TaxID=751969 RepID=A0A939DRA2_9ALTE|nr:redoxin family protein [Bowmanella dokdonensis]MBN7826917.1 redoxin family protein [Bowmanella dokdonensis]